MEINRLTKEELIYELKIRGIDDVSSCESMKKSLRYLMRLAQSSSYAFPTYPYKCEEDCDALENQVEEITQLLESFTGNKSSAEFKKIETKIAHSLGRVNRCLATTTAEKKAKTTILVQLIGLQSELKSKVKKNTLSSTALSISHLVDQSLLEEDHESSDE